MGIVMSSQSVTEQIAALPEAERFARMMEYFTGMGYEAALDAMKEKYKSMTEENPSKEPPEFEYLAARMRKEFEGEFGEWLKQFSVIQIKPYKMLDEPVPEPVLAVDLTDSELRTILNVLKHELPRVGITEGEQELIWKLEEKLKSGCVDASGHPFVGELKETT